MDSKNRSIIKMINKKIYIEIGTLIGIFILLSSCISAFAVSSKYWEEYPVTISPGEIKDIKIILQNMAGTEDINAKAIIIEGSEIAEITDLNDIYLVPVGGKTDVNIRINISTDAEIKDTYNLKLSFTTVTAEESGTFGFSSSIEKVIPILITEKPKTEKETTSILWIIYLIGIIILILIIFFVMKKRKKSK